jgi:uncharacterized membrane protein YeaQ/YmgE (transglycosylase-associated protein family)
MKKDTLLEIILGTIGGLIFAIGMCMCLIAEWNMLKAGVVVAVIGFLILLCIIPVYRRTHPRKKHGPVNWGIVITWIVGVVGSLVMGFGMSKVLVENASQTDMIIGIITGIIGLVICVLNYPIYAYIKGNRD